MAERRRKRHPVRALLIALLFLAITAALIVFIPRAIFPTQATQIPTPGEVILPPTAPAAIVTPTATGK